MLQNKTQASDPQLYPSSETSGQVWLASLPRKLQETSGQIGEVLGIDSLMIKKLITKHDESSQPAAAMDLLDQFIVSKCFVIVYECLAGLEKIRSSAAQVSLLPSQNSEES